MKVYHASSVIIEHPDTQHSRLYLDFGSGFYVTTLIEQAQKYGTRFIRRGKDAFINIYEMEDSLSQWKIMRFPQYDESWLDFITECRSGKSVGDYDIIIGGIANDKIFRTIDLYFAGDISKKECLSRLIYEKPNNQICIRNQNVLDQSLTYINSQRL